MGVYTANTNALIMKFESGTYSNASGTGVWIGMVQDHSVDENFTKEFIRYQGAASRNVQHIEPTVIDINGTISFYPQNWRLLGYALGSITDSGSPSPYAHALSETEVCAGNAFTSGANGPFMSFTLEDSRGCDTGQNFIRTYGGCMVDSMTISSDSPGIINCEVSYIAQTVNFTSGAATAVTPDTTSPYVYSDTYIDIPSGTRIQNLRGWSLSINNNLDAPHYTTGSRHIGTPLPMNRDYEFTCTWDSNTTNSKTLYESYHLGGSEFNMLIGLVAEAGSKQAFITLSGCVVMSMDTPSPVEGVDEHTITIMPKSCSVQVDDLIFKYNPW